MKRHDPSPGLLDLMADTGQKPKALSSDNPPATKTEHCEIDLVLHYDNEARGEILVSVDGNETKAVWLQKTEIQFTVTPERRPATTTQGKPIDGGLPLVAVNLPEWLGREKGLTPA